MVWKETLKGNASVVYAPHLDSDDFCKDSNADFFRSVILSAANPKKHTGIISSYPRDISPSTDDRPFFFFMERLSHILSPNPKEHPARRMAMPFLYGSAVFFAFIAVTVTFIPLYLRAGSGIRNVPYRTRIIVYFAMLGTGFMLIEISLLQRLTVFLGHPIYSFVVVLATLLCASGLGSRVSNQFKKPTSLVRVLAAIIVLVLIYAIFVYDLFIGLMSISKPMRIVLAVLTIAPLGFLLGMCFPMGIQIAIRFNRTLVPWAWGVNGAFSVFGSILSIVLALNLGFKATLIGGAVCYTVAWIIISTMIKIDSQALSSSHISSPF
jgi:hypothetical protein